MHLCSKLSTITFSDFDSIDRSVVSDDVDAEMSWGNPLTSPDTRSLALDLVSFHWLKRNSCKQLMSLVHREQLDWWWPMNRNCTRSHTNKHDWLLNEHTAAHVMNNVVVHVVGGVLNKRKWNSHRAYIIVITIFHFAKANLAPVSCYTMPLCLFPYL